MKRIALILLTATALIAAGCGGNSDENAYVKQLNAADAKAAAALSSLGSPSSDSAKAAANSFDTAADRVALVVKDYKAIDPPENAEHSHAMTITGLNGLVALLRDTADDFRSATTAADFAQIKRDADSLTSAKPFKQLAAARVELAKAGYKVQDPATAR